MNEIRMPDRRVDILDALDALAEMTVDTTTWPDLTNAIHWLVDDTWWDKRDPETAIGDFLKNPEEAAAIRAVLTPLLAILDDLGPHEPDKRYLTDPRWPDVRTQAQAAITCLRDDSPTA